MNVAPTRAAALTPLSPAGIAVVGLIGPDAIALLDRVFRPRSPKSGPEAHAAWPPERLRLGQMTDGDEVIDDGIVAVRLDADGMGHVEFTTHGGPRIVQRLLLALKRHGATIVAADEMAADVWPVDSVLDREAHQWVPHAQTRRAAAWLLRQRELLPAATREIARLIAATPTVARDRMAALLETHVTAARMLHGFSIAIVGPPNAGKSTLANALCGRPRVLVSDIPGTTRDYVSEPAAIDGIPATLIDTAGLRHANDPIEAEAVLRARRQAAEADLRLVVLDIAAPMDEDSRNVLGEFTPKDPSLLVLNKADLPAAVPTDSLPNEWARVATAVSAAKGDGIEALRHQIANVMGLSPDFDRKAAVFTARQAGILKRALSATPTERQRMTESLNGLLA